MTCLLLAETVDSFCREDVHVYLDFYSLSQAPFHITPDPQFLFLSSSHKAVLGTMAYGIASQQGFVAVFGEAGVGKTTLLRAYLTHVNRQELKTIFVDNADLAFDDLLRLIFRELGHPATTDAPRQMVQQLQQVLAEEARQSRSVVVIIDGAQAMPVETLAQLPRLSTLEDATGKPLQIVLVGQPELHRTLAQDALRHLRQHIAVRATILPLTRQESLAYIRHRLAHVTKGNQPLSTAEALWRIVCYAKGLPREVNILCTNALIAGVATQQKPITAALVQRVIAESWSGKRISAWQLGLASSAALALLGSLLWLAPWQGRHDAPIFAPQAMLAQGGDRIAEETAASAVPSQVPERETNRGEHDAKSRALMTQKSAASGDVPAQQPATDTQVMQEPVMRPEPARPTHKEHLDTQAMDRLLTRLEPAAKTTLPTARRSKVAKQRGAKPLPRAAAGPGAPRFALLPRRSDPVPPGPAPEFRFFDDPRTPKIVNDSSSE